MKRMRYAALGALALGSGPAFATTLPPSAVFDSTGTLSYSAAGGLTASGTLDAQYRQPPLGSRPYIFSTGLSFGALTVTPNLTLSLPALQITEDTVIPGDCVFNFCFPDTVIPGITLPAITQTISPSLPLTGLGTVFEGSVTSPAIPAGDILAFDYGSLLLGAPLSLGDLVQDQFETGATTVSVTGGLGPFNSVFDYDGVLQPGNEQILATYALNVTGPGFLADFENLVLGLLNDNAALLNEFAFDLFLDSNPCGFLSGGQSLCNDFLADLDPTLLSVTVNSLGSFSADYTLNKSIAPVPLPAALPLMASGLGLLGFMGWRRRQNRAA